MTSQDGQLGVILEEETIIAEDLNAHSYELNVEGDKR
jgi:hypothetical protein